MLAVGTLLVLETMVKGTALLDMVVTGRDCRELE